MHINLGVVTNLKTRGQTKPNRFVQLSNPKTADNVNNQFIVHCITSSALAHKNLM